MKKEQKPINSEQIKALLAKKHETDVFVNELSFWVETRCFRMDSWALCRGSNLVVSYEIKVDRRDFLNDKKWQNYISASNEFYFVCPWDLIKPEELPPEAGLIWVAKTGNRLYQKKPCVRTIADHSIFIHCLKSILFNRAKINNNNEFLTKENKKEFFKRWLEQKKLDYEFGHNVSKSIRETIKKQIRDVKNASDEVMWKYESLKDFKLALLKVTGLPENTDEMTLVGEARKIMLGRDDVHSWRRIKEIADMELEKRK